MFSGSLVAIVTPMHADGGIDWPAWDRLLARHLEAGTSGIVVGGTTGESATLTDAELHGAGRARARAAQRTRGADRRGRHQQHGDHRRACAAAVGRRRRCVCWWSRRPTTSRHRRACIGISRRWPRPPAVPVVLYNVPSRTAVDLLPATVARLAKLPRVVAVKEAVASMERVRELVAIDRRAVRGALGR